MARYMVIRTSGLSPSGDILVDRFDKRADAENFFKMVKKRDAFLIDTRLIIVDNNGKFKVRK